MQHIILMGFLGRDPEKRKTSNGTGVVTFSVAVSIYSKSSSLPDGKGNVTQWYRINVWDEHLHKITHHLKKGSAVIVCGDLDVPRIYETKEGEKKIGLSVKATSIKFTSFQKTETKPEVSFSSSLNEEVNAEELPF